MIFSIATRLFYHTRLQSDLMTLFSPDVTAVTLRLPYLGNIKVEEKMENRKHLRVTELKPRTLRVLHPKRGYLYEQTVYQMDLSGGGMKVALLRPIPNGSLIEIDLELHDRKLTVLGEILWCQENAEEKIFKAGIKFHDCSHEDQKRLIQYCYRTQRRMHKAKVSEPRQLPLRAEAL